MSDPQRPAVVLLSGGLDSATALAVARRDGFACHALSFDYGQRHAAELRAAAAVADQLGVASHRTVTLDLAALGGSALTDVTLDVPKDRGDDAMAASIPVTYVPARNTIFLSHALAFAEVLGATDIYIGVNAVDYSGYPDCRPAFIDAFERLANLATRAGIEAAEAPDAPGGVTSGRHRLRVHAPLIDLAKPDIIRLGRSLGVDYGLTHSCYDPVADPDRPLGVRPCEHCDACLLRQRAFHDLGETDPLLINR